MVDDMPGEPDVEDSGVEIPIQPEGSPFANADEVAELQAMSDGQNLAAEPFSHE